MAAMLRLLRSKCARAKSARAAGACGATALAFSRPQLEAYDEKPAPFDAMGYNRVVVKGVPYPGFAREEWLDELQSGFKLRESDIVIATFPKCGTTWMQQIVLTLLFGGDKSKVPRPAWQAPWIEASVCRKHLGLSGGGSGPAMTLSELLEWDGSCEALDTPPRRVFKTHAPVQRVPWSGGMSGCGAAKVVVVVRNPKDACVSMFHHSRDIKPFNYTGDLEHFTTRLFLPGNNESGCFWAWHAGWEEVAAKHPGSVMWVSYEELQRDFPGTVGRLAQFLAIPVSDDVIVQTMQGSSLSSMRSDWAAFNQELESKGMDRIETRVRKGAVGSWRDDIQGDLLAEFDRVHRAKASGHGLKYEFNFGDAHSRM